MNDIANATAQELTVLDGLAMQARTLRLSINMNMWQLARVFIEAKELVPHGEWGKWLQDNADVSEKTAQDMMAAYRRFGGRPQFETLGRAKTFKLLPLPEGTEERFMEEHDVESMTTREIQEAVKQARAEAQARIDAAEARVRELEEREPVIPQEVTDELAARRQEAEAYRADLERITQNAKDSLAEALQLRRDKMQLERDMQEKDELLQEQQDALNRAQDDLLNMQSAQARGDAERTPTDELTLDLFSAAVREFMGLCARMPYMGGSFAIMPQQTKNSYNELLHTIEGWCEKSRQALDSYAVEGGIIIG